MGLQRNSPTSFIKSIESTFINQTTPLISALQSLFGGKKPFQVNNRKNDQVVSYVKLSGFIDVIINEN